MQVFENVLDLFQADGNSDETFADAMRLALFARIGRMGHAGRVLDQRFGIAPG